MLQQLLWRWELGSVYGAVGYGNARLELQKRKYGKNKPKRHLFVEMSGTAAERNLIGEDLD